MSSPATVDAFAPAPPPQPASRVAALLDQLFRAVPEPPFVVRLWDGSEWPERSANPARFTLTLREPAALRRLILARDEAALAAGYVSGEYDLDGDLEAVAPVAEAMLASPPSLGQRLRILAGALRLPRRAGNGRATTAAPVSPATSDGRQPQLRGRRHSRERDRQAVTYHYDASNDFYRLFLDPHMVYSCAYFADPAEPLELAQVRKLDYVCRKLRLRAGDRLLDIGCGWGALIVHAATHYGVSADGITLSENQATVARERVRAAGLEDRCTVRIADYRELRDTATYDKVASVGMFEHVGEAAMDAYFAQVFRLLKPGGAFLNHAIGGSLQEALEGSDAPTFGDRWVFPDHELLPIAVALRGAESAGFDVRDVENLREHYALTLRHWVRGLEARREQAIRAGGEPVWRAWRLCFAACAHQFDADKIKLYQTLLVKPGGNGQAGVPLTRRDWYVS